MVELVVAALGFKVVEGGAVWLFLRHRKRKRLLNNSDVEPTKIPLLDDQLAKIAGEPNKVEEFAAKKVAAMARKVVTTKAFDHSIACIINHKSELRNKQIKVLSLPVDIQL